MNNNLNEPSKSNQLGRITKLNSFINSFIKDLSFHLEKISSSKLLPSLEKNTILTFAKFDKNYAICFDYKEKKIYYMPKNKIIGPLPKPGEALKFYSNDEFYVDYTAILAEENKIEDYLKECKLAK